VPAPFPPSSNRWARRLVAGAAVVVVAVPAALMAWVRSPGATGEGHVPPQPVAFNHALHVTGFRIDCRYCHAGAERERFAGVPATTTCVPCHSDLYLRSELFAPVRAALATGTAIPWNRVHALPDHVVFHHGAHVSEGIGCESCHGRVDRMSRVEQGAPLTMGWCLDCHREPERHLRPVEEVTTMGWTPARPQEALGRTLRARYRIADERRLTTCTVCHR
jgi:hypothetical protein